MALDMGVGVTTTGTLRWGWVWWWHHLLPQRCDRYRTDRSGAGGMV